MTRVRLSTAKRRAIVAQFGGLCQMCRCQLDHRGFELDHHIPLAIGGEDTAENLRPLCRPCHRIKTGSDATRTAKARRIEAKHFGFKAPSARPLRSRGFPKAEPQGRASRPLSKPLPPRPEAM